MHLFFLKICFSFPSATHEQGLGNATRPLRDDRQHLLAPLCGDAPSLWHRRETPGEQLQDPPGNLLLKRWLRRSFQHQTGPARTPAAFRVRLRSEVDVRRCIYVCCIQINTLNS